MGNEKRDYDLIVIGSGPAGLMAAISASERGAKVLVLEQKNEAAKKLYATGNGRCNLTNTNWESGVYRGGGAAFADTLVRTYDTGWLLCLFEKMGLYTRQIGEYLYPYNEQASAVVSALLGECHRLGVKLHTQEMGKDILINDSAKGSGYRVVTAAGEYPCKTVLIAVGGKASPSHGSDGNFNKVIRALGHTIIRQESALVPLVMADKSLQKLSGTRLKCKVTLKTEGDDTTRQETGEIIFNKNTISGIPILQLSRFATKAMADGKKVSVLLDLFPELDQNSVERLLENGFGTRLDPDQADRDRTTVTALSFLVPFSFAGYLAEQPLDNGREVVKPDRIACQNDAKVLSHLAAALKGFPIRIQSDAGSSRAQVSAGGVDLAQITENLESRFHPGLYFAGEILDVDGTCGGYNLHFAFASGYLAGCSVADSVIGRGANARF